MFPKPKICDFLTGESKERVKHTTECDMQGSKVIWLGVIVVTCGHSWGTVPPHGKGTAGLCKNWDPCGHVGGQSC